MLWVIYNPYDFDHEVVWRWDNPRFLNANGEWGALVDAEVFTFSEKLAISSDPYGEWMELPECLIRKG